MKEILEVVFSVSVLSFVIGSMIAMGLSLTVRQILEPLRTKRLVLLSLAANFVLVPLLEIAPGIRIPGEQTQYADILAGLDERKKVAKSKEHAF
jgi:predicted Na+-dependent transporter